MTNQINTDNAYVLKTGSLKKTGGEYALILLSEKNIDDILLLQEAALSALPEDQKSFLLKKDREFFEKHFAGGNTVIGIEHEGALIAQSVIVNPTADNPKTGMTDIRLKAKPEKTTVLQGIVVHPDFRGNKLITEMIDAWIDLAKSQKRTDALAEVSLENFHSWAAFLKEGLQIHSIGTDPADGTELYNIHARIKPLAKKRLKEEFNKKSRRTVDVPHDDIEKQKELLSKGYKGVNADNDSKSIKFRRRRKFGVFSDKPRN